MTESNEFLSDKIEHLIDSNDQQNNEYFLSDSINYFEQSDLTISEFCTIFNTKTGTKTNNLKEVMNFIDLILKNNNEEEENFLNENKKNKLKEKLNKKKLKNNEISKNYQEINYQNLNLSSEIDQLKEENLKLTNFYNQL